jgi:hypothetical protein
MASTVLTVESLLVGFSDLPRVSGEPTFEDITITRQHLNQNCMNIQSYSGGGNHGHLGLVMTPVEYIMQIPGVAGYMRPPNPDATATIPAEATPVAAQNLILAHAEKSSAYRLANNVDKVCCKSIIDAFDDKFLAARANPVVRYANKTDISLIAHLKDCYEFISPIELVANYDRMCQTYDPNRPIEDLSKKMQDGRAYAQAGQNRTGNSRSLTSRTPSSLTWASMETHARNGKNMTFWRKLGKISKCTSQPSIACTVNKPNSTSNRLPSSKSRAAKLAGCIVGGAVGGSSHAGNRKCNI